MRGKPYHPGPVSDHFDGRRFFSPGQPSPDKSLGQLLAWQRSGARARWPREVAVVQAVPPARSQPARVTMVGHASLLIQLAGLNLLTDPVWSPRASPFRFAGPRRVTAPGVAFESLPRIDAVLLSHNHYDHLDLATLRQLHARDAPLMVMPLGTDATVRRGVRGARIVTGDWQAQVALPGGDVVLHLTRANHWSSRGLRDRRMALWCGYWIEAPGASVWFAGDTGYGDGAIFREIRARHGRPDIALIPIGAYAPRWFMADQHVDPVQAVRIFQDLGARQGLGMHWGTFQLTDEPREQPPALLAAALEAEGIAPARFRAMAPGEVHQAPELGGAADAASAASVGAAGDQR